MGKKPNLDRDQAAEGRLNIVIDPELKEKFRLLCLIGGKGMSEKAVELIEAWVAERLEKSGIDVDALRRLGE